METTLWVFGGSTWESDVSSSGISFANMTSNISINLGFEMIPDIDYPTTI